MIGYVYLTINDVNNICYIGKRQKPRFDKSYKGSGTHLKLAFKKYGKGAFHTYILEWCLTKRDLCNAEKRWIARFKELGAELYNIGEGGDGGNMVDWGSLPLERRNEINKKNSESHFGEKNGFYGKHHSEKTKQLLRGKNVGRTRPEGLKKYKAQQRENLPKIEQIDKKTGEVVNEWDNWCDAGKAVSEQRCAYAHISECCKGTRKTAYGYRWRIAEVGWIL